MRGWPTDFEPLQEKMQVTNVPRRPLLLAIDTATDWAGVALMQMVDATFQAEMSWRARRRQTEECLPVAQRLLQQVGQDVDDLGALAVTTGPGSFTGVRIGISIIKGIGMGLSRSPRLIGVPALSVTAFPYLELAATLEISPRIIPFLIAGRGRYVWTELRPDSPLYRPQASEHQSGRLPRMVDNLRGGDAPVWLVGERDQAVQNAVRALPHVHAPDPISALRRPAQLARLALRLLDDGQEDTLDTLAPLYLNDPS